MTDEDYWKSVPVPDQNILWQLAENVPLAPFLVKTIDERLERALILTVRNKPVWNDPDHSLGLFNIAVTTNDEIKKKLVNTREGKGLHLSAQNLFNEEDMQTFTWTY